VGGFFSWGAVWLFLAPPSTSALASDLSTLQGAWLEDSGDYHLYKTSRSS
jgi:hypothetical protein